MKMRTWSEVVLDVLGVALLLGSASAMVVVASSGCVHQDPYRDALYRFGAAGKDIIQDMPAATTDGQKARLQAFHGAVDEALKLGAK